MENNIFFYHKDWNGYCNLNENIITRTEYPDETGTYYIKNNKIFIKWDKWNNEIFCLFEKNKYILEEIFNEKYINLFIIDNETNYQIILNKNNNIFYHLLNKNINGNYTINNKYIILEIDNIIKEYKLFNDNNYYLNDNTIFFELLIIDDNVKKKYLFNKLQKNFYDSSISHLLCGNYEMIDNTISMNWNNGINKIFYTNNYSSNLDNLYNFYKNINIIKPNIIKIDNKILFSNISLCKKKIILTSMYYQNEPIDFKNISFKIYQNKDKFNNDLFNNDLINNDLFNNELINNDIINNEKDILNLDEINIIQKNIFENNDYEASSSIILELENIHNDLLLYIEYKKYNFKIYLKQLNIPEYNIYSMTLFKDDYLLLSRYFKYYSNLGVNLFYIYYNDKIKNDLLEFLLSIVKNNNYIIYIIQWDYEYWIKSSYTPNFKQHYAQTMAINDALHILKNYGNYILYNDLDEFIILNDNKTFNDIINENNNTDIFVFKNRFCKMGTNLIKYKDFDNEFDLNNIIQGNYWDNYREKNLIKTENIYIMGVHSYFEYLNKKEININVAGEFYHIINFEEKNRENLMTEYIR